MRYLLPAELGLVLLLLAAAGRSISYCGDARPYVIGPWRQHKSRAFRPVTLTRTECCCRRRAGRFHTGVGHARRACEPVLLPTILGRSFSKNQLQKSR